MPSVNARTTWISRRSTSVVARLNIRVIPKAGADQVAGLRADELVVRVKAAPEAGKANTAACRTVAAFLDVAPSTVEVVRGHTSRHKVLEVPLPQDELAVRLASAELLG